MTNSGVPSGDAVIATTRWVATSGRPETSWKVITSPTETSSGGTGWTTTSVPGGKSGSIEEVSTVYGVPPPARGTSTQIASTPSTTTMTSQARTWLHHG